MGSVVIRGHNNISSYEQLKRIMYDCTLELILDIGKTKEFCSPMEFRVEISDLIVDKDWDLRDFFGDREWVIERSFRIVGDYPKPVYMYDGAFEIPFKDMMNDFCDEHQEVIPILKEWEANKIPRFRMLDIYMEEYQSVEEYEKFIEEARKLLRKYAGMRDISISKAKINLPYFDDPEDLIAYLEREMEIMTEE